MLEARVQNKRKLINVSIALTWELLLDHSPFE